MAKKDRSLVPRVNWFDGQKVSEDNLDTEQIHKISNLSNIILDFHGTGIVNPEPFSTRILLDTRVPGTYGSNSSKNTIEGGSFDGQGINVDQQPSDTIRGSRLEIEVADTDIMGRNRVKLVILGRVFNGVDSSGILTSEVMEFAENGKLITKNFYVDVISILFNNFSGGTGKTEYVASKDSLNLAGTDGWLRVREAEPLMVFAAADGVKEIDAPNFDLNTFITSDVANSITDEITTALGSSNDINDLYLELVSKEQINFPRNGDSTISYGQKFLSKADNLQRIDVLLSVERDDAQTTGSEFDFSGDLVVSVFKLADDIKCSSDAVPDNLIDFDPETSPLIEISLSQDDLLALGYKLGADPQVVSFNFSGTLIADPNIEPNILVDNFYAFFISRRGDNRTGKILLEKGYDKVSRKTSQSEPLSISEQFDKRNTKFVEFDPVTSRYVDDSTSSMWFKVYSDSVEVVDGAAYADDGVAVVVPKTEDTVGGLEVSFFENNISLGDVAEGSHNYIMLSHLEKFMTPGQHPRTGNFVFTEIGDAASASALTSTELTSLQEDTTPVLLARVTDKNVRDAQPITGVFDKPGLIQTDRIVIENPSSSLLTANLINRIITPDVDCDCNARYRIVEATCVEVLAGDLDRDGELTNDDILDMLDIVGTTINSEATEKSILGGDLDVVTFLQADLDDNSTIDGVDIELLEDAIDGYVNFTTQEKLKFLVLFLENVLDEDDYPTIFIDVLATGVTSAGTNQLVFKTVTQNEALTLRAGDSVVIESGFSDTGSYLIASRTVSSDGTNTVTATVTNVDGSAVSFNGTTGFDVTVRSGTAVNTFADNNDLVDIPFTSNNYSITFVDAPFEPHFIDICDLRRLVGTSFIETIVPDPCLPDDDSCVPADTCSPQYANQTYVPNSMYIHGDILESPGVPYHGDIEYVNIKVPLPAGTIEDCQVNIYDAFVKSEGGTDKTAAGYPALKYSDGTLVGCNDSGNSTDITKGKVRFGQAIASLHVDALVDGYAVDGYADASITSTAIESIHEDFIDDSFTGFSTWTADTGNSPIVTISNPAGPNQPAVFTLVTSGDVVERFGRLNSPLASQNFEDDFIVDFSAVRAVWQTATLTSGIISSFATLTISNATTTSYLKFGWRHVAGQAVKLFYRGVIENLSSVVISTFDYEIDAPDDVGDTVMFRLRRNADVVSAYYIVPGKLTATGAEIGDYIRIGSNPVVQPGAGTAVMDFEMSQANSPNIGLGFASRLTEIVIRSKYNSNDIITTMPIGRDSGTGKIDRGVLTFPLNLNKRTNLISATLTLTADGSSVAGDNFNVIPLDNINTDNIGKLYNIPQAENVSLISTFSPGVVTVGQEITVSLTPAYISFLSEAGHLPGFVKGFVIEPSSTATTSFSISPSASILLTYEDVTTGVIFKVGVSMNHSTGLVTLNTKNILYDTIIDTDRTVLNFGVYLKKAGFINQNVEISINDLNRIGIGTCFDENTLDDTTEECFFVTGSTSVGTLVEGPFPCNLHLP